MSNCGPGLPRFSSWGEDAELEAIEVESTHTIEIDRFVPHCAIDQRFFDSPYYVMPSAPVGQEAFAVIREAMRGKGMVALGRLVLSKRELREARWGRINASSDAMFAIIHLLATFIADLLKSPRRVEVENLFLRHQLNVSEFSIQTRVF